MVTGTLWDCWTQQLTPHEMEQSWETVSLTGETNGRLTFVNGPGVLVNGHAIALSLEDPTAPGKIFRSGALYNGLPPGASSPGGPVPAGSAIEAFVANPVPVLPITIDMAMPPVPFMPTSDTTITAIPTPLFAPNKITATVSGTTTHLLSTRVSFTYTAELNLLPSTSELHTDAVIDVIVNSGSISFATGTTVPDAIAQSILDLLSGVMASKINPLVAKALSAAASASAISEAAKTVGKASGTMPTTLPAGVVLSIRRITIGSSSILVLPALGAFGGLFNKLFPSGGGSTNCLLSSMASLYGAGLQLDVFRGFRDKQLSASPFGRWLVALYYEHSEEVTALLIAEPEIGRRALVLSERIDRALRRNNPLETDLVNDALALIDEIAVKSSSRLRNAAQTLLSHFRVENQRLARFDFSG